MSASEKVLALLRARSPAPVSLVDLAAASGIQQFARRIRELRAAGWDIEYIHSPKAYRLRSRKQRAAKSEQAPISGKQRYRILHRDHSRCRRCGRSMEDGVRLMVDHINPRAWGGQTEDSNLWTLCEQCNLGKKDWESDVDAETMLAVMGEKSGRSRLRRYLKLRPNQIVTKAELQIIAGITEYQRRLRELRQEEGMRIISNLEDASLRPGDYRYEP